MLISISPLRGRLRSLNYRTARQFLQAGVVLAAVLLLSRFCQPGRFSLGFQHDIDLQLSVLSEGNGVYTINGKTNLPDNARLAIAAVRYLEPPQSSSLSSEAKPSYSILAYQTATVTNGQWQAQLNLWQVAEDGRYQESWQFEQAALRLNLEPSQDVIFLATLNPIGKVEQLPALEQQLRNKRLAISGKHLYTAADGQQYVQVQQVQPVALPTDRTSPPVRRPEDLNGGWGERYLMPGEPPNPYVLEQPTERQTDAPMRREEFLW
ncbi:hypothetical protein [Thermoleptolyngbya sp. C42_A2020_037]|uniref:hypothetical protein n=1 Tax=Thermoleptolyngbya sp. C42_A2020_037 TaxID=2747799 RepID=UPI0019EA0E1D|nr:hypothetical protein [Thermoleptolyngbya sp. C42_A2020_037]MBF2086098.1 hypothetical protein [Thermoleptolyngbya sp. C42_A2020_037]